MMDLDPDSLFRADVLAEMSNVALLDLFQYESRNPRSVYLPVLRKELLARLSLEVHP